MDKTKQFKALVRVGWKMADAARAYAEAAGGGVQTLHQRVDYPDGKVHIMLFVEPDGCAYPPECYEAKPNTQKPKHSNPAINSVNSVNRVSKNKEDKQ